MAAEPDGTIRGSCKECGEAAEPCVCNGDGLYRGVLEEQDSGGMAAADPVPEPGKNGGGG
jgi:hypothetical protein